MSYKAAIIRWCTKFETPEEQDRRRQSEARARLAASRQARRAMPPTDRRGAVEWNPLAVLFGVLLGSWFGKR
jgi:hypothetical protein